jgi:hypothetical protein
MSDVLWVSAWIILLGGLLPSAASAGGPLSIVFATYAEDAASLRNVALMAESIRTFGGACSGQPIRAYMPADLAGDRETEAMLEGLGVEIRPSETPEDALWFYFAGKVFASAAAEKDATGEAEILAWLDEDTIMLQEPREFLLPEGKTLGYRPVMHKNIGTLQTDAIDTFWGRVFGLLGVPDSSLFPMVTPADGDTIRPYFNAGCLIVRPERGVMARWAKCFQTVYRDSLLADMCRDDSKRRVFIHQAALAGAILANLDRDELIELSPSINYPIFFEQMFGARRTFDDLTGVVTFRHESYFKLPAKDWDKKLKGPADRIAWMKEHLVAP